MITPDDFDDDDEFEIALDVIRASYYEQSENNIIFQGIPDQEEEEISQGLEFSTS